MILREMILMPALVIYMILFLAIRKKTSKQKLFVGSMIYFISVFIIMMTLFPMPVDPVVLQNHRDLGLQYTNNIVPFQMMYNIIKSESIAGAIYQIGGNFIMLLPLGYLIPMVTDKKIDLQKAILIMCCIALCIESTQFMIGQILNFNYRCFDIDDIILNASGGILGYIMFTKTYPILNKVFNITYFENENKSTLNNILYSRYFIENE
ncbi:VanZ family protein [Intestinibacter bartlettii]|uniref:VanZ family protein n=1 Tax=Intestinibacter bartlettii TaxID=261299 RepID=A0ABS6DZC3_9FIRM|nr:VanZ family protein [Intestinibacter bartlettii]MBU5336587.1 VanZ family protein [Intestinibacter bartlettii]